MPSALESERDSRVELTEQQRNFLPHLEAAADARRPVLLRALMAEGSAIAARPLFQPRQLDSRAQATRLYHRRGRTTGDAQAFRPAQQDNLYGKLWYRYELDNIRGGGMFLATA